MILRERDADTDWPDKADGTLESRVYYVQNWRADVVALFTDAGQTIQQVRYDPYGVPFGIAKTDLDADGDQHRSTSPHEDLARRDRSHAGPVGFTLVELLVCIVIVAVLLGLALPSLANVRRRARLAGSLVANRQIVASLGAYASDFDDAFPYYHTPGRPEVPPKIDGRTLPARYFSSILSLWPNLLVPDYLASGPPVIEGPARLLPPNLRDRFLVTDFSSRTPSSQTRPTSRAESPPTVPRTSAPHAGMISPSPRERNCSSMARQSSRPLARDSVRLPRAASDGPTAPLASSSLGNGLPTGCVARLRRAALAGARHPRRPCGHRRLNRAAAHKNPGVEPGLEKCPAQDSNLKPAD